MHENLINQLNFYIKQKETTASTFVGRMVGSALHKEINTLRSAVQAISTLIEFHDAVELYKLQAKECLEKAESISHLALEEFREKLMDTFIVRGLGDDASIFSLEEISNIINSMHTELDKKEYFVPEKAGDNDA